MKPDQARARYLVSLAYNQAVEAGNLPEAGPISYLPIDGLGASMRAVFTGWYCEGAVIDVVYLDEHVAVGWLLRSRGQVRLADFYPVSSIILEMPFGKDTKILKQTRKPRIEGMVHHLRQPPKVYCKSNTPCP